MEKTITLAALAALNLNTCTIKDDSPRGCKTVSAADVRPGDMVVLDNHFTKVVEDAPAKSQPEQEQSPADIIAAARKAIENEPARSAWVRGVKLYALELLENVEAHNLTAEQLRAPAAVNAAMLSGAENWKQFSRGGCSLVCGVDIAERLCTPAELRRCDGGERRPNSREDWLSVQTRALFVASHITARAISAAAHGEVIA